VLAAPWRDLPEEAQRVVAEEGDHGDAWWRNRRQWHPPSRPAAAAAAAAAAPPPPTPVQEWWLRDGVTVIAACQDRSDALVEAVTSWLAAAGVDEVVLLDWSSAAPIAGLLAAAAPAAVADPRLLLARVAGQGRGWVLSRAYNAAARLASRTTLLKVDCDTVLSPRFVAAHPTDGRTFYAGDWRSLAAPTADERLHMNGLLLVRRADFALIHGYDERIVTYGWDDSDIVARLSTFRTPRSMDYGRARHVRHAASRRTGRQGAQTLLPPDNPLAAAVEIQRNRLLLKPPRLPPWGAAARGVVYNVRSVFLDVRNGTTTARVPPPRPPPPPPRGDGADDAPAVAPKRYYLLRVANEVPSAADLVSEADGADASKRAIRIILKSRRGVPAYHKDLPLDFYLGLAARYAAADAGASPFARVDVIPGGGGHGGGGGAIGPVVAAEPPSGCAARLLTLAALRAATSPPLLSFFAAAAAANVSGGGDGGGGGLPAVGRAGVASAALGRLSASFRHRRDGPSDDDGAARPRAAADGTGDAHGGGGGGTGGPLVPPPAGSAGWHARMLWRHPDAGCGCRFSALFAPVDTELFETAGDAIPAGAGPDGPAAAAAAVEHPPPADAAAAAAAEPPAVPVSRHRVAAASVRAALAAAADGVTAAGAAAAARPPGSAPATALVTCGVDVRAGADADGAYVAAVRHQLRALVPDGALRSAVVAGALRRAAAADAAAAAAAAAAAPGPPPPPPLPAASADERLAVDVWSRPRGGLQSPRVAAVTRGLRAAAAAVRAGGDAAAVGALLAGCPPGGGGAGHAALLERLPELAVIVAALRLADARCLALPR